jgi:riboflavin biosynthesis pyrimidine reductase
MVQQLLPAPGSADLDDEELLALYDPGELPMVRFNFVSTADGAATHQGVTGTLGTAADKRIFALLRRHADVILIGAGTIRTEGYGGELLDAPAQAWRAERGLAPHPAIAVVSGSLNLDPGMPFFAKAPVRPIVITSAAAPENRRRALGAVADVIEGGRTAVEPGIAVRELQARGHRRIHSEGGPVLFAAFQRAGAVDSLCLSISPLLGGGQARRIADGPGEELQAMRLVLLLEEEGALFAEYRGSRRGQG